MTVRVPLDVSLTLPHTVLVISWMNVCCRDLPLASDRQGSILVGLFINNAFCVSLSLVCSCCCYVRSTSPITPPPVFTDSPASTAFRPWSYQPPPSSQSLVEIYFAADNRPSLNHPVGSESQRLWTRFKFISCYDKHLYFSHLSLLIEVQCFISPPQKTSCN